METLKRALYDASVLAENTWEDELRNLFGIKYINARYDTKQNKSTPKLKMLYDARRNAIKAWQSIELN